MGATSFDPHGSKQATSGADPWGFDGGSTVDPWGIEGGGGADPWSGFIDPLPGWIDG